METKLLELRDKATFIPLLAVRVASKNEGQRYLIRRCGFGLPSEEVIITRLSGESRASADPYFWADRTFTVAHDYIRKNFDKLNDGDVIDVEFILGETTQPKTSERMETAL